MKVVYSTKKLKKICTNASESDKKFGKNMSFKLSQRISELEAASSVEEMIRFKIGRCHRLKGDLKNSYAVHLVQPFRLVFTVVGNKLQIACIEEIVDYH